MKKHYPAKALSRLLTTVITLLNLAIPSLNTPALAATTSWHGRIYDVSNSSVITHEEFVNRVKNSQVIVLGEKHYDPEVQKGEGAIMALVLSALSDTAGNFTTAWEFLNYGDQARTDELYSKYTKGELTVEEFLAQTQGSANASMYAPMVQVNHAFGGKFVGVNLPRSQKAIVVEKGLDALDPALIPPGFALGSAKYFERFEAMMAGHGSPEKVRNYFAAQCLTDDVMAYQLSLNLGSVPSFLIVGGFHVDYFDGVVARLKARLPGKLVTSINIYNAHDYNEDELLGLLHDSQYGAIANYVLFVGEPFFNQ